MLKRIAVLVSGGGTNLQALIDAQRRGEIKNGEICAVISSKSGVFALERAKNAGIPSFVISKDEYPDRASLTHAICDKLDELSIDLVVLAGFMLVLSPELTERRPGAVINVHPALIPSFCGDGFYGLRVHEKALEYGVKLSGATVHFVTEETDGGPIIAQKAVAVLEDDTPESLQRRVMEQAEWELLPRAVSLFCEGRLRTEGRTVKISGGQNGDFKP